MTGSQENSGRFETAPRDFVGIATGTLVYIGVADRAKFDSLALPIADSGPNEDGHVLTKALDSQGVTVIFQHWLKQKTVAAIIADGVKLRAERGS